MTALKTDIQILPSILSADFGRLIEEAKTVDIPEVEFLHVDVMDGNFVPNLTMGAQVVKSLGDQTRFRMDAHLMVEHPETYIPRFAEAGAEIITIHQEASKHLHRHIRRIKDLGLNAGVSLNPATPLNSIEYLLGDVDLVLVMTVNPGFGGQQFIESMLEKVNKLNQIKQSSGYGFIIEVDGGIDSITAPLVCKSGAQYLVAGNAVFGQTDRPAAIRKILKAGRSANAVEI